jgi:hypothetical protein
MSTRHDAIATPQMNAQERLIFTIYVAMGAIIATFLASTSALWLLGL